MWWIDSKHKGSSINRLQNWIAINDIRYDNEKGAVTEGGNLESKLSSDRGVEPDEIKGVSFLRAPNT